MAENEARTIVDRLSKVGAQKPLLHMHTCGQEKGIKTRQQKWHKPQNYNYSAR
jgi:hypothetical protein